MAKEKNIDEFALYESLKTFECPCNWNFPDSIFAHEDMIQNKMLQLQTKINNLEKIELPPNEFQWKDWRKYVHCVALSYYYSKVDKKDQAFEMIDKALATVEAGEIKDNFYKSHKSSFFHVLLAMKGRFHFEKGDCVKAKEMADKIKSQSSMSDREKAALLGIKASVFNEFGDDCSLFILDDIRKAAKLNPDEAEWSFILGKVLRRIRKLAAFFEIPEKEEIAALQNAYDKKKCSAYCLFLAISYKELSTKLFQKCGLEKFRQEIQGLNENALKLFRETLTYDDLSATALSKISRGFAELPYPYKDVEKAKELALKSVEMDSANPMTLHTLAMHYERHDLDFEKALEYNEKALQNGSYGSGMDIIKINLKKDPNYDPMPILNDLKEKFIGPGYLNETIMQEACYYLMVKGDLNKALDMFMKIMVETPDLHQLKVCKPIWLQVKTPISIFELLYHELKSSRNKNKSTTFMDALMKIKQLHPKLFDKEVDEHFLDNLKKESEEIVKKHARQKPTAPSRYKNLNMDRADRNYGHQNDRADYRESRSHNWRDNRRNDSRNSFGDTRYDNSRNYNQNRNNENYRNSDYRYNNRRSFGNQDEDARLDNRSNLSRNIQDNSNDSNNQNETVDRNNENKANDRNKSDDKNTSNKSYDTNNRNKSYDRYAQNKNNDKTNRNKSTDKPNKENQRNNRSKSVDEKQKEKDQNCTQTVADSQNVDKNFVEGKRKSVPRQKSFEKKKVGDKVVGAGGKNRETNNRTSKNREKNNCTSKNSEKKSDNKIEIVEGMVHDEIEIVEGNTSTTPDNTVVTEKPKNLEDKSRVDDSVEPKEDFIYNEDEQNSDEEEYRKKMNSKINRQKFVERMKQLSETVKHETVTEHRKTSNTAPVVKQISNKKEEGVQETLKSENKPANCSYVTESNGVEKSSNPVVSGTDPIEGGPSNNAKITSQIEISTDHIIDQISKLDIEEKKRDSRIGEQSKVTETCEVNDEEKQAGEPSRPSESQNVASSMLVEQFKQLSKEQIEILLKVVQKSEKKKKKAKKTAEKQAEKENSEESPEISSVPPPKISVKTAGNQAIRQPTGPSENNFALRKK